MKLCWMVRGSSPALRRRMVSSLPRFAQSREEPSPRSRFERRLTPSAINQILIAFGDESGKRIHEALLDGARILACLEAADGVVAADEAFAQREIEFAG